MLKICKQCGKEYETHNSKSKYCSISCSNKGRNHKSIKCNCDICGKEIEVIYSRYMKNKHNYCSRKCQEKGKTLFYTGKNNPQYNKSTVKCKTCGEEIEVNQYRYNHQKYFYCSIECKAEHQKELLRGKNNPFYGKRHNEKTKNDISIANIGQVPWNKGYKVPWKTDEEREKDRTIYGEEYDKWRQAVYKRDNYTCQCCGDKTGGNLNAHHIYAYAIYKDKRLNVDNGITLCKKCHKDFHKMYGKGKNTKEQYLEFIKIIKSA